MAKFPVLLDRGITKIDQAIAFAALLRAMGIKVEQVEFYFLCLDDPSAIPADAYDLDARLHYKKAHGKESATQVVVEAFGLTGFDLVLKDLAQNNATGFMRQGEGALTKLGQKIGDLKASTTPMREHLIEVATRYAKVGEAVMHGVIEPEGARAEFLAAFPEFKADSSKKPWHLSGYAYQLFLEQGATNEVRGEIDWWLAKFDAAEESQERAKKRVAAMDLKAVTIAGLNVTTIYGRADEVARTMFEVFGDLDVIIAVKPNSAAILPRFGQGLAPKMAKLHAKLEELEPGAWDLIERGHEAFLLSGSARRTALVPTELAHKKFPLYGVMTDAWAEKAA